MTWLWRISSSLLVAGVGLAATVSGRVQLADSREASVRRQNDYSGVVVWLEPVGRTAPLGDSRKAAMVQKNKRFTPHILAITVGTTVDFPNYDPIFHNAFSNFSGQPFDTGLYPPGTSHGVQFRREGIVRVFCNIHPSMSAVIVVLSTPYYAVSAQDGGIRMDNVPRGEYRLHAWHERAAEPALRALERTLRVEGDRVEFAPLRISESGYLEVPHQNKYGQEYPPATSDYGPHPGMHR